jgi:hypothetical protein
MANTKTNRTVISKAFSAVFSYSAGIRGKAPYFFTGANAQSRDVWPSFGWATRLRSATPHSTALP